MGFESVGGATEPVPPPGVLGSEVRQSGSGSRAQTVGHGQSGMVRIPFP